MTPTDWRRILIAFSVLAVAWCGAGFIVFRNYNTLQDQQDRVSDLAVNVTASLCLQAYAPESGGHPTERELVEEYVRNLPIPVDISVCKQAIAKARNQIEGKEPG